MIAYLWFLGLAVLLLVVAALPLIMMYLIALAVIRIVTKFKKGGDREIGA